MKRLLLTAVLAVLMIAEVHAESFTISDIRVNGLQRVSAGSVFGALPLNVGEQADDGRLVDATRALFKTGFFQDIQLGRDGNVLVITVVERPSVASIEIEGNKAISTEDLIDLFELKTTNWLSFFKNDDKYAREKLSGDLERLRSYYLDRGYINMDIASTQVSITPDKKNVYITVNVNEGQKYSVKSVKLSGDLKVPEDQVKSLLLVKPGQVFSRKVMTTTSELITRRLGNEGYTFANVNGVPTPNDEDHTVDITFVVDPGKRAYVNRINFRGNTKSADEVLRREMRQMEGGWASTYLIDQSKTRLDRLGFFKEVNVETPPVPGTDDQVDVNYAVEEQASGSITVASCSSH